MIASLDSRDVQFLLSENQPTGIISYDEVIVALIQVLPIDAAHWSVTTYRFCPLVRLFLLKISNYKTIISNFPKCESQKIVNIFSPISFSMCFGREIRANIFLLCTQVRSRLVSRSGPDWSFSQD